MNNINKFFSIKEINEKIKNLLEGDSLLSNLWVKGEISNFTAHSSGHLYFTLKDTSGKLKCVMFRSKADKITFQPAQGMEILAAGYISVYLRDGQYQLYVDEMLPFGAGALHIAYEQLKEKLASEGLFAENKKRRIPFLAEKIGIVTSLSGAALRDILTVLKRRMPLSNILISPAAVQGIESPHSIWSALDKIYKQNIDIIIVGRGGGSIEELWSFNDEKVVRKISESPVPIISAVGHETDFTLADFVADVRAATPSMAAEIAVPHYFDLHKKNKEFNKRLSKAYENFFGQERQRIEILLKNRMIRDPLSLLSKFQQEIDTLKSRLFAAGEIKVRNERSNIGIFAGRLDSLSPLKTLSRGYAVCYNRNGEIIKSASFIEAEETINVRLQKGMLSCLVKEKKEE